MAMVVNTMDEFETTDELEILIADMHRSINRMDRIGKESDHAQEARIDQFVRQMGAAVDYLYTIHDEILDETYSDVKDALITDHQYAAESITYWINKGDDIAIIAARLDTTEEVVVDMCGEYGWGV